MKKFNYITIILTAAALLSGCYKEEPLHSEWEYTEPVPEITDGPTEAHKLCYELYKKYDVHVYYNLSGIDAARSGVGYRQTTSIGLANFFALPFQAADDDSGYVFLKMLKGFLSLLPDEMVSSGLYRRHVLVKINPGPVKYRDEQGNSYFSYANAQDDQGIVHYGYLMNDSDTDNTLLSSPERWKWNICYIFFKGHQNALLKTNTDFPANFGTISEGLYYYDNLNPTNPFYNRVTRAYNRPIAKECGFVHPFGGLNSYTGNPYDDWGTYVAWILTEPYDQKIVDLENYPRIRTKYEIVIDFYKSRYGLDLEALGDTYRAMVID